MNLPAPVGRVHVGSAVRPRGKSHDFHVAPEDHLNSTHRPEAGFGIINPCPAA